MTKLQLDNSGLNGVLEIQIEADETLIMAMAVNARKTTVEWKTKLDLSTVHDLEYLKINKDNL